MSFSLENVNSSNPNYFITDTVIANGGSLSSAVALGGTRLVGVFMPAQWTTAAVTFQVSPDGVTYYNMMLPDGTEQSLTAVAGNYVAFDNDLIGKFAGIKFVKIRSGVAATAVNQAAERTLKLSSRIV